MVRLYIKGIPAMIPVVGALAEDVRSSDGTVYRNELAVGRECLLNDSAHQFKIVQGVEACVCAFAGGLQRVAIQCKKETFNCAGSLKSGLILRQCAWVVFRLVLNIPSKL